jgi:hypothetical protein
MTQKLATTAIRE